MKRIISITLLLVMCLGLFAGCGEKKDPSTSYDLEGAKKYLEAMYMSDSVDTASDYTVAGVVTISDVEYTVNWTCDNSKVIITRGDNKLVNIDVPAPEAEAIKYKLTATIVAPDDSEITTSFNRRVPASASAGKTDEDIVNEAYELENGEIMDGVSTLTGVITMIKSPYDDGYKNITVIIQIGELTDKRIECYRMVGDGCAELCIGDTITVTGTLKNYNGTIEFDAGCNLDKVVPGERVTAPEDPKQIVEAAYALSSGSSLPYSATLTGIVTEITDAFTEQFKNVTLKIVIDGCEDKPILCYRLKGDCAAEIEVGDTITVVGYIVNYNGTIEYNSGCKASNLVKGDGTLPDLPETPTTPSTPSTPSGPSANLATGTYIIADNKADGTIVAGKCPGKDNNFGYLYDDYTAAEKHNTTIYTFTSVGNGKYTIQDCDGRYLGVSGTYKSFQLYTKNEGDNCLWTISTGKNGEYVVKNVSNGRYIDYSESFESFGAYLDSEVPEDGQVQLIAAKADSSTPSTPSTPSQPSGETVTVADGKYVIYASAYNMALSSTYTGFYNNGVEVKEQAGAMTGYTDAEIWTITNNGDGTVCISINGQKLAMGDSYSSMPLGEKNDKWVIIDAGNNQVYIKNVARELYIEWYAKMNNWSGYGTIASGSEGMFALTLLGV